MLQLGGLLVAFAAIVGLANRRLPLWLAMTAGAAIIAAVAGKPAAVIAGVAWRSLSGGETLSLVTAIYLISVICRLLRATGMLSELVDSLVTLARSLKTTVATIPFLFGCLPMPGGAILSAPMVDSLGDRLGFSAVRKAAANLVFRHVGYFIFPLAPSLVLMAELADISLGRLILAQLPVSVACAAAAAVWFLYIPEPAVNHRIAARGRRGARDETAASSACRPRPDRRRAALTFVTAASPILTAIILGPAAGLALHWSLLAGAACGVAVARHRGRLTLPLAREVLGNRFSLDMALAMAAIMLLRGMFGELEIIAALVDRLRQSGFPTGLLFAALPLAVGYVSAAQTATLAITWPLLLPLVPAGHSVLPYAVMIYVMAYVAYFMSPLHLCQIMTNEHFGVRLTDVYRDYAPVVLVVILTAVALFYIYL